MGIYLSCGIAEICGSKFKPVKKILAFLFLIVSTIAFSQSLVQDQLFGTNAETFSIPTGTTSETNVLFQYPDKKIVACGYTYDISCNCFYNIMFRVDACGKTDSSFGINGLVRHTFEQRNAGNGYTLLPNGKMIVVGVQSDGNSGSQQFPFIARYKYDGKPDSTFGINGTTKVSSIGPADLTSVYQLDTGKILCTNGPLMMQFDSLGVLDQTFGNNGILIQSVPPPFNFYYQSNSVRRSDGKIISVSSVYTGVDNDKYVTQICYDTEGLIDSSFGVNGFSIDYNFVLGSAPPRLILQSDDKLIAIRQNIFETAIIMARYNSNGSLDTTFGTNGYLSVQSSRLVYVSKFDDDSFLIGVSQGGVPIQYFRISANGIIDPSFTLNGSAFFQTMGNNGPSPQAGLAYGNNEIVMAGCNSGANGSSAVAFTKFTLTSGIASITQNDNTLNANLPEDQFTFQWYRDGLLVVGDTTSTITVFQNGEYLVEASNLAGCTSSDTFTVLMNGINDSIKPTDIKIYPNPSSGNIQLELNSEIKSGTISVIHISGKLILEKQFNNTSLLSFDLTRFSKGMYILQLISEEGKSNHKIIIQ